MISAWSFLEALAGDLLENRGTGRADLSQACRQMIDTRFMNPIGVEQLAHELGVDRTTLFRQFRQAYGYSPRDYLQRTRLARAMELLRNSEEPVKRIAPQCGFHDPQYFSRAFRKAFGVSPGVWREQA
jgi:AraC-like DNA-binding protein